MPTDSENMPAPIDPLGFEPFDKICMELLMKFARLFPNFWKWYFNEPLCALKCALVIQTITST